MSEGERRRRASRHLAPGVLSAMGVLATVALARGEQGAEKLEPRDVVRDVLSRNPAIAAAICDRRSASWLVEGEAARYPFTLQLDGAFTSTATPTLVAGSSPSQGSVVDGKRDTITAGAELKKHLVWGTDLSLRVEANRQLTTQFYSLATLSALGVADTTALPGINADGSLTLRAGPGYGGAVMLSLRQPLLRGAGQVVSEASLRSARVSLTAAELGRDRTASELLRDALSAYWESWYANEAVEIERRGLQIARMERDEAKRRIDGGSLAPVEGLTLENQYSSREDDLVNAEGQLRRRLAELAKLLGKAGRSEFLSVSEEPPPDSRSPPPNLREQVLTASPEIRVLENEVKLAIVQAQSAGDTLRPRLDLDAYVRADGLGYDDVPAALRQLSRFGAVSSHVGLTFELPLDDTQHRSEVARAILGIQGARHRLEQARQQVLADLDVATQAEASAHKRVDIALRTLELAGQRADAEHNRFTTGSSTAIQVLDAEDAVRSAALRSARAKTDLVQAQIGIAHLAGSLLASTRHELERSDAAGCRRTAPPYRASLGLVPEY